MKVSEDTALAIERYTALAIESSEMGSLERAGWEEMRSYAVHALRGLLLDNPERWRFAGDMAASRAKMRGDA